ncbi:hypothetical protein GLYMA_06G059600v4 [Glycine max]|nr:hypothetical protein GLYMA_06G059600v4 [Glycine max]KAH1124384.1 hypothetical protein GYH30_014214 [Glycine max]
MASKLCDSCKSATATLYCRPDAAFLCGACDSKVHAANKLASRHPRVVLCEVCEQAPAHVTCKADAAALCLACDRDIHSANPLASRHERIPVTPFFESVHSVKASSPINFHHRFFSDADADADVSTEEAEAASWLLPNPKTDLNSSQYLFSETEPVPYIDLDYAAMDPKTEQKSSATADGVVPVQSNFEPFTYGYKYNTTLSQSQSHMSQSVSLIRRSLTVVYLLTFLFLRNRLNLNLLVGFYLFFIFSGIFSVVDGSWSCAGREHDVGDIELQLQQSGTGDGDGAVLGGG